MGLLKVAAGDGEAHGPSAACSPSGPPRSLGWRGRTATARRPSARCCRVRACCWRGGGGPASHSTRSACPALQPPRPRLRRPPESGGHVRDPAGTLTPRVVWGVGCGEVRQALCHDRPASGSWEACVLRDPGFALRLSLLPLQTLAAIGLPGPCGRWSTILSLAVSAAGVWAHTSICTDAVHECS